MSAISSVFAEILTNNRIRNDFLGVWNPATSKLHNDFMPSEVILNATDIAVLKGNVGTLQSQVSTLASDPASIATLQSDVSTLKTFAGTLTTSASDISVLKSNVSALHLRIQARLTPLLRILLRLLRFKPMIGVRTRLHKI